MICMGFRVLLLIWCRTIVLIPWIYSFLMMNGSNCLFFSTSNPLNLPYNPCFIKIESLLKLQLILKFTHVFRVYNHFSLFKTLKFVKIHFTLIATTWITTSLSRNSPLEVFKRSLITESSFWCILMEFTNQHLWN